MSNIDVETVVDDVVAALQGAIGTGAGNIRALVQSQSQQIATQAAMVAKERALGSLRNNDPLFDFFMEQLKRHTRELALTVAGMTILTLEQAWNAVVGVIWGAINTVLEGANLGALSIPVLPPPGN